MWDDRKAVLEDSFLNDLGSIPHFFGLEYNRDNLRIARGQYRPISKISLTIDHMLWKNDPRGYHLTSILFHMLNTMLVFLIMLMLYRLFTPSTNGPPGSYVYITALIGAALFASHPAATEAVNWIKNRAILLSVFFGLLSLISFMEYLRNERYKVFFFTSSVVMFILSLLSKETGLSIPFILVVLMILIHGYRDFKSIAIKISPFLILALLYLLMKFILFTNTPFFIPLKDSYSIYTRILIILKSFWKYLFILFLPFKLNAERIFSVPKTIFSKEVLAGFFCLLISLFIFYRSWKKHKLTAFFLSWVILSTLAVSNIIFVETRPIAEQRLYFASIPFCLSLPFLLYYFSLNQKSTLKEKITFICACGLMLVLVYTSITIKRNSVWKDPYTFWSDTLKASPYSPRANINMGSAFYAKGDFSTSAYYCKKAIDLDPKDYKGYSSLGIALAALGKNKDAVASLKKAIDLFPYDPETFNNLGITYSSSGEYKKAVSTYKKGLSLDPDNGRLHHNLGAFYAMNKKKDKGMEELTKAQTLDPYSPGTYNNIGNIHIMNGNIEKAITAYKEALFYNPRHYNTLVNLSALFKRMGHYSESAYAFATAELFRSIDSSGENSTDNVFFSYRTEILPSHDNVAPDKRTLIVLGDAFQILEKNKKAEEFYMKALKTDPDNVTAYNRLGILKTKMGEIEQALTFFFKALQTSPEKTESYNNAGIVLYSVKDKRYAIEMFKKALSLDPDNRIANQNLFNIFSIEGRDKEMKEIFNRTLKNGTASPEMYEKQILALINDGKSAEILEIADTIPENMPLSSTAYNQIGIAYGKKGNTDKALYFFQKAVDTEENSVEAVFNLAVTSRDKGLEDKAFSLFEKALELDENNINIISFFASFCFETGRYKKSEQLYSRLIDLEPDNTNAMNLLGLSFAEQQKFPEAAEIFIKILDKDPDNPGIYYNIGNVYQAEKLYDKALTFFKKTIEMNPGYTGAYIQMAKCYLKLNDPEKAEEFYLKAKKTGLSDIYLEKEIKHKQGENE